jgi:hypothetical protein
MCKKIMIALTILAFLSVMFSGVAIADYENSKEFVKIGGSVEVPRDIIAKNAVAIGGSVTIYGKVLEEAVAIGGSVFLEDGAVVKGDAVAIGGHVKKGQDTVIEGDVVEIAFPGCKAFEGICKPEMWIKYGFWFRIIGFIVFIALALLITALFPKSIESMSKRISKEFPKTFLTGLLAVLIFIPVVPLLVITIIGILVVPFWILLYIAGGFFGFLGITQFAGRKILKSFKVKEAAIVFNVIVGIVILGLIGLIPMLGALINGLALCSGLGSVVLTRFGTKS